MTRSIERVAGQRYDNGQSKRFDRLFFQTVMGAERNTFELIRRAFSSKVYERPEQAVAHAAKLFIAEVMLFFKRPRKK